MKEVLLSLEEAFRTEYPSEKSFPYKKGSFSFLADTFVYQN
jgi:hypothetical protein